MPGKGKTTHHCPLRNGKKGNCRSGAKVPHAPSIKYCSAHQAYCSVPGCEIIFLQSEACWEHGRKKDKKVDELDKKKKDKLDKKEDKLDGYRSGRRNAGT